MENTNGNPFFVAFKLILNCYIFGVIHCPSIGSETWSPVVKLWQYLHHSQLFLLARSFVRSYFHFDNINSLVSYEFKGMSNKCQKRFIFFCYYWTSCEISELKMLNAILVIHLSFNQMGKESEGVKRGREKRVWADTFYICTEASYPRFGANFSMAICCCCARCR